MKYLTGNNNQGKATLISVEAISKIEIIANDGSWDVYFMGTNQKENFTLVDIYESFEEAIAKMWERTNVPP